MNNRSMNSYEDSESSIQKVQQENERLASQNRQLQEQLLIYKPLFHQSQDAVFIISLDTLCHVAVNERAGELLGYTQEELIGKSIAEIILPDEYPQSEGIKDRLLAGEQIPLYERTFQHKDGTTIVVELQVSLVYDANGRPSHIQSIARDVTRRHAIEKSLQQTTLNWQNVKTLQEVGAAVSSSLDLDQILNIIAVQTTKLLNAQTCTIMLFQPPDDLVWIASIGLAAEFAHVRRQKADEGLAGWIVTNQQTLYVEDITRSDTLLFSELVEKLGYTTYLGVPMLLEQNLIGIVEVYDKAYRHFKDEEIALLEAVTDQAAAAVDKARLFAELKERVAEAEWQYRAVRALSSELDTTDVLQKLAEYLVDALDATSAYILEIGQGQTIVLVNEYWADTAVSAERLKEKGNIYSALDYPQYLEALHTGQICTMHFDDETLSAKEKELFTVHQAKSILIVPIIRAGIAYGLAEIWDSGCKRSFAAQDIRMAEIIAQHAASVIENVRLFEQISGQADQLEREVTQRTAELLESNSKLRKEIIERQRVEKQLKEQADFLLLINKIADTTFHVFDIETVYQRVVEALVEYPRFSAAVVLLLNRQRDMLETVAYADVRGNTQTHINRVPVRNSLAGLAVLSGKIVQSRDVSKDERAHKKLLDLAQNLLSGLAIVPIIQNEQVIGVLNVFLPHKEGITLLEEEMLASVSSTVGLAILNAQYVTQIETEIAERNQVEKALQIYMDELKRSNLELQEFAYIASHDLQEPLRKIQAFGDRLARQYAPQLDERGVDYLHRMQNAAGRMRLLIDNLLLFSRVTTAAQPFTTVDLNDVLTAVLSDLSVGIEEKSALIQTEQLPVIEAEPMQMHQLLQNLIGNALKFVRPDVQPLVEVQCRHVQEKDVVTGILNHQPMVQLIVRDNGIGIDGQYQERIFNLFERLHSRQQYEGTGIGLAICKKIVARHNGRIVVNSQLNAGTTFTITLPMTQKQ